MYNKMDGVDNRSINSDDEGSFNQVANTSMSMREFQSLPAVSSISSDSNCQNASVRSGYRMRCSSWERNNTIFTVSNCDDIAIRNEDNIQENRGLPEEYFLPSPMIHSSSIENSDFQLNSLDDGSEHNVDMIHMTRGEPMGKESEGTDFFMPSVNYPSTSAGFPDLNSDNQPDASDLWDSESENSSEVNQHAERPPLIGQSNEHRGQVASGMSYNSSDDVSSSYTSAISGNWREDDELDASNGKVTRLKDSLSLKVSILLGDEIESRESSCASPADDVIPETEKLESDDVLPEATAFRDENVSDDIINEFAQTNDHFKFSRKDIDSMTVVKPNEVDSEVEKLSTSDIRPVSPTSVSSAASSKRLEWDSGADIGYKAIETSAISRTEAEVLQWANHLLPAITRTEPEGKSFQKQKGAGGVKAVTKTVASNQNKLQVSSKAPSEAKSCFDVNNINLASSMTSITSEMYQEVLYGNKNDSKVTVEDDVIVRVRKLLNQTSKSSLGSPAKTASEASQSSTPNSARGSRRSSGLKQPSCPENSPSHSSSSWSAKSGNTVVMTPVGQRIEDVSDEDEYSLFVPCTPKHENKIFLRQTRPTNVEFSSVFVQTEPKIETSVPRPIFPRGKSKSLDILPTVLVDAAVNTEFPYSPSSEENVTSPDDVLLQQCNSFGSSFVQADQNLIIEAPKYHNQDAMLQTDIDKLHEESRADWVQDESMQTELAANDAAGSSGVKCKIPSAYRKPSQQFTPYWPPGSDQMYFTIQDSSTSGYKADMSSFALRHSCQNDECANGPQNVARTAVEHSNSSSDEHFSPLNPSKQSSSTDISLPTKKFVDRTQWLQKMAQIESNRVRHVSNERNPLYSTNQNVQSPQQIPAESWHQLSTYSSNTSSEIIYDHKKKHRSRNKTSRSSYHNQIAKLKSLIVEQRHSYLRKLWREVEKIEKLEALLPHISHSMTDTSATMSVDESELIEYLQHNIEKSKHKQKHKKRMSQEIPKVATITRADTRDFCQSFPSPVPQGVNTQVKVPMNVSIGLQTCVEEPRKRETVDEKQKKPVGWVIPLNQSKCLLDKQQHMSLQEAFKQQVPLVNRIQHRHQELNQAAQNRQETVPVRDSALLEDLRKLVLNDRHSNKQPANGLQKKQKPKRVFTHQQMRDQTERMYQKLPEVVQKKTRRLRERESETNRLLAQIYQKRVQQKTLKGQVSWQHTQKCLAF